MPFSKDIARHMIRCIYKGSGFIARQEMQCLVFKADFTLGVSAICCGLQKYGQMGRSLVQLPPECCHGACILPPLRQRY